MSGGWRRGPPERFVRAMFDDIADSYDLLNQVLSFGLHRSWRRRAAASVSPRPGGWVLDLGCGTGALGALLAGQARVVGVDLSHGMLLRARRRAPGLRLAGGSALRLPLRDGLLDAVASAFVLRNLRDLGRAFEEMARVLRPGGEVALVDITEPDGRTFRRLFRAYLAVVAPAAGTLFGKGAAYRYLARSLGQIPPPEEVCALLAGAGFADCRAQRLSGGAVTLFTARLPLKSL